VVDVVDTIGAGDAFVAAFLTWWTNHSLKRGDAGNLDALVDATAAAISVAVADCTVQGASLPPGFRWPRNQNPSADAAARSLTTSP
jgi:sugar/nucleoside kinase (ribokinase family)